MSHINHINRKLVNNHRLHIQMLRLVTWNVLGCFFICLNKPLTTFCLWYFTSLTFTFYSSNNLIRLWLHSYIHFSQALMSMLRTRICWLLYIEQLRHKMKYVPNPHVNSFCCKGATTRLYCSNLSSLSLLLFFFSFVCREPWSYF